MNNPYEVNSPEWQLYENMAGLEMQASAAVADSERALKRAAEARFKAEKYRLALEKITRDA